MFRHRGGSATFESKRLLEKISKKHLAFQLGWSATLDIWLLYTRLDAFFVFYSHKLPGQVDREHFKYVSLPFTVGWPILSFLRPHAGLAFRIPLGSINDTKFKDNGIIQSCKEKLNGYILGCGIDVGSILIDIYLEFASRLVDRKNMSTYIQHGEKQYRDKTIGIKVCYNLLG